MKSRIIFLGPPGSGKGTQAELVSKKTKIPHISTGEIFRKILRSNSKLSKEIKKFVTSGKLVPDNLVFKTIEPFVKKKKFLLDGFPRNLNQAVVLDKSLSWKNSVEKVFYFNLSDAEVIKRLTSRRVCPKCGATYNIYTKTPKKDNMCDKCGTKLIIRDDDKIQTVKNRLKVYHKETKPLVKFYKEKELLTTIDASKEIKDITKEILYELKAK